MSRVLQIVAGPESAALILIAFTHGFCRWQNTGAAGEVALKEKLLWLLPVIAVPWVFSTVLWAGGRSWWWLARVNVALVIGLAVCAWSLASGLGTPGSGPKGQEIGFLVSMGIGLILASPANTMVGAMILADRKPAFAEWFASHRFLGSFLTLLASIPLGVALNIVVWSVVGFVGGLVMAFRR